MSNGETQNFEPVCDKQPTVRDIVVDLSNAVCEQHEIIKLIGGAIIGPERFDRKSIESNNTPPLFDWLFDIMGYIKQNNEDLMMIKRTLF